MTSNLFNCGRVKYLLDTFVFLRTSGVDKQVYSSFVLNNLLQTYTIFFSFNLKQEREGYMFLLIAIIQAEERWISCFFLIRREK